jgi:hypothetical protein
MEHIRQKIDLARGIEDLAYTVVNTNGWNLPLNQHPSIVEHPEVFEIVDTDIPSDAQYLNYTS